MTTRTEKDSLGPVEVPANRLWGAQTQRSLENFRISGERQPRELLLSLAMIKKAAAEANTELGELDARLSKAIAQAAGTAMMRPRRVEPKASTTELPKCLK